MMRNAAAQLFAVAVFTWLGLALMLVAALLLLRVPLGLALTLDRLRQRPAAEGDASRRRFLARAAAATATAATAGAGVFALRSATGPALISEVPVRVPRLPKALSGLTIAQISDLHVGPTIREREVWRVVEQVNAMKPDLVAITGDLVDGTVEQLGAATGQLARLQSRFGTYFVTGNHEYYSGVEAWAAELERLGITLLRNRRVAIGGDFSFDLAGVDDYSGSGGGENPSSDLGRALEGRDPDRALVLLAHQPRAGAISKAVQAGVELQLSGHTHGGQIMPFNLLVGAMFPYLAGLYRHEENGRSGQVFVSRGTGYWGPPLRLGSPPELAKLVLTT
jgi:predicted MPP superfamily phosphohydrolase